MNAISCCIPSGTGYPWNRARVSGVLETVPYFLEGLLVWPSLETADAKWEQKNIQ